MADAASTTPKTRKRTTAKKPAAAKKTAVARKPAAPKSNTAEAKSRAFLLYCYMQSESLFRNQGSSDDKAQRRQFVAQTLLAGR